MACSACLPDVSFDANCEFVSVGGNRRTMYFIPECYIDGTVTREYLTNIITDIPVEAGQNFLKVTGYQDTLQITTEANPQSKSVTQTLTIQLSTLGEGLEKDEAAQNAVDFFDSIVRSTEPLVAIVEDRNGNRKVVGIDSGLEYSEGGLDTGAAKDDLAAYTLTLTAVESGQPPVLSADYVIPVAS